MYRKAGEGTTVYYFNMSNNLFTLSFNYWKKEKEKYKEIILHLGNYQLCSSNGHFQMISPHRWFFLWQHILQGFIASILLLYEFFSLSHPNMKFSVHEIQVLYNLSVSVSICIMYYVSCSWDMIFILFFSRLKLKN